MYISIFRWMSTLNRKTSPAAAPGAPELLCVAGHRTGSLIR